MIEEVTGLDQLGPGPHQKERDRQHQVPAEGHEPADGKPHQEGPAKPDQDAPPGDRVSVEVGREEVEIDLRRGPTNPDDDGHRRHHQARGEAHSDPQRLLVQGGEREGELGEHRGLVYAPAGRHAPFSLSRSRPVTTRISLLPGRRNNPDPEVHPALRAVAPARGCIICWFPSVCPPAAGPPEPAGEPGAIW